jgi:hypothetical protein
MKIVDKTNRYAKHVKSDGSTEGGPKWTDITVACLKAFIAMHIYMGMKREPNVKAYWHWEGSIFHCPIISNIMIRERFCEIRRCLHTTNPATYEHIEKDQPGYDKMRQTRWLVEEIRKACMREWSLGKYLTIDEMMIRYKGSYCPAHQYMPKKPEKWGIKVWCLADSSSKFVYNFDIYCGKNVEAEVRVVVPQGKASLAHAIVMKLLQGLEDRGHCVVMDNYFFSIGLFKDLALKGTYATGTIRSNRIGLPTRLRTLKSWKRSPHGHLEWAMHESRNISCVMWKDKCPVLIISSHAMLVGFPCVPCDEVPRRNGATRDFIPTSPVLREYTTYMRGVDVAVQLRALYSSQTRSHKWWHWIFWFLIDMTEVNMYIMYLSRAAEGPNPIPQPMTHLQFKIALVEALLRSWERRIDVNNVELTHRPEIHMPSPSHLRWPCVVCKRQKPSTYCYQCGFKFMCWKEGCYEVLHTALARALKL